jgi:DNA primase
LAQLVKKDISETNKQYKSDQKAFDVVKNDTLAQSAKVDIQYVLEHQIIQILLLYGDIEEDFEDVSHKANEEGELYEHKEINKYKVYQRIYLSLQEDEVKLANPIFSAIYNDIIAYYNRVEKFDIEHYLQQIPEEIAQEVTTILMNEEREVIHNWEGQQIVVKLKEQTVSQFVTETILTLRWYLVNKIIDELKSDIIKKKQDDNTEILSMVRDYLGLTNVFSKKLGRVISRHH